MQKFEFQTEVSDLLNLMIHSLYSNKEIFLRELISNASDALDKLNFSILTDDKFKSINFNPRIDIKLDKENKTLTISDNGIGMSRDDLISNLGTIARSGTKNFIKNITGDNKKDSNLIGQFGVGFYSAFMVADKIEVLSKKALEDDAFIWISDATNFEIKQSTKDEIGTDIKLFLKDDEFLNEFTIENIITKYSNHIPYAIFMDKTKFENEKQVIQNTQINKAKALWRLPKSTLKPKDYFDFYSQISHDSNEPLLYIHTKAEGKIEYSTLFFIPSIAPFDLYRVDYESGVKLYVKRVFITDDEKELLPPYLRFVRGIIDVEDLPLNVSREILQDNVIMRSVKDASVKKILGELEKLKNNDFDKYKKFYSIFGKVLKEGLYGFSANKDELLDLLIFNTNLRENITLKDYKQSMKNSEILYICSGKNSKNSPLLEEYNKNNIEVLICEDEIDTIIMPNIYEYDKTQLKSISAIDSEDIKADEKMEKIIGIFKDSLKDKVKDVKLTSKLINSPACISFDKNDPDFAMQQILKQMGNDNIPNILPILNINKDHEIFEKLQKDDTMSATVANIILDLAKLQEGMQIQNPNEFVKNINEIILKSLD